MVLVTCYDYHSVSIKLFAKWGTMKLSDVFEHKIRLLLWFLTAIVLFKISRYNYLFFHIVTELFMITIAGWIFLLSWNTRKVNEGLLPLFGIVYLNVGIVSLLHMLSYKGMTIFAQSDLNISVKFWILERYLESFGVVAALIWYKKKINTELILAISICITLLLVSAILYTPFFPDSIADGHSTSAFNVYSNILFIIANFTAIILLLKKRDQIAAYIQKLFILSFVMSIGTGLFFLSWNSPENACIFTGHFLAILSCYFMYKALVITGIQDPYNTLLYHIKNNEQELRRSRDHLETKVFERTKDLDLINKNLQNEIEERKKKELELRKIEERMILLLKNSKISITLFDLDFKPLTLFQNNDQPVTSQLNFYQFSECPGWEVLEKMMKTVIDQKCGLREDIEFKTHKESMFFVVVVEPTFDENNSVTGVIVIALDITEKIKIESVLKKKHQAIESIYTIATSFNYNKETIYEKICQSIALILEVPVVTIVKLQDNNIKEYFRCFNGSYQHAEESVDCAICRVMLSAKTACQISGDLQTLYPQSNCLTMGKTKTYLGVPVFSRTEEVTGVICVLDIKERRFSDEQIQLLEIFARYISNEIEKDMFVKELVQSREMALLGQLTSGVAHEVRNPLNAIWAITEALFMDIDGDETNLIYKEHIHSQVKRLSRLMQDLLDLGKPHIRNDQFSFTALCVETINLWSHNDTERTHKINLNIQDNYDPFLIQGDSTKIQQVLMNLLDNASEHSPPDSIITVNIEKSESRFVVLSICDHGKGLPADVRNRIFEPFFTTRKGGTGLGLSIVKHIVENHNGSIIMLNNDPPPGATVKIRLPLSTESPGSCTGEMVGSDRGQEQNQYGSPVI